MFANMSLNELLHSGGLTLHILIFCSIIVTAATIERFLFYARNKMDQEQFLLQLIEPLKKKEITKALEITEKQKSILSNIPRAILLRSSRTKEVMEDAAESSVNEEMLYFDKRLTIFGTMAVTAPFIGLMGTVFGIIRAFADIAQKGSVGPATVASGVSEALIATAAGLIVAIPSAIFFNYFKNRSGVIKKRALLGASKLIEILNGLNNGIELDEKLYR